MKSLKHQKGFTAVAAALVAFLAVTFVIVAFAILSYIGAYDKGVGYENNIDAAVENNEQINGNFKLKLMDSVSTSKLNAGQVTALIEAANKARYGGEGSKASWQWIQENNLALDQSINKQLLQVIEAGRNDFQAAQTRLIDTKRAYETALEKQYILGEGWWLKMAGFPKINLKEQKYQAVSSAGAKEAFRTGVDTPVDFGVK